MSDHVTASNPEVAVRAYLNFLADPSSVRDVVLIEQLRDELKDVTDPIRKVKLLSELERAETGDGEGVKLGFILHAKGWADSQSVTEAAFRSMGVPDDVLKAAGFSAGGRRMPASPPATRVTKLATVMPKQRAPKVSIEQIKRHALSQEGPFTIRSVMEGVGGSPATVAKALAELQDEGRIADAGPDPDYSARGKRPNRFEVVRR
jgi:hypothetical protein